MASRLAATLAVLASLAVVAVGCGSSGTKSNGVENQSAQQIVQSARDAAKSAKSVHVSGSVNAGSPVSVDLYLVRDVGGKGTITTQGATFQVVVVGGKVYVKADKASLAKLGNATAAALLADKWFVAPSSIPQLSSLSSLTDLNALFSSALSRTGKLVKGDTTKIDGNPVIAVTAAKKDGTLYVATTGTPYPLRLEGSQSNQGKIDFTDWDASVKVEAPPHPLDFSNLGG